MEFQPNATGYTVNTWACRCLNTDLYLSKPEGTYKCLDDHNEFVGATEEKSCVGILEGAVKTVLNDNNGKTCGVTLGCKNSAVEQQRTRWT